MMCFHLNGKVDPADEPVEHAVVHGGSKGVGGAVRHVRPIQGQRDLSSLSPSAVVRCGSSWIPDKTKTERGWRSFVHSIVVATPDRTKRAKKKKGTEE